MTWEMIIVWSVVIAAAVIIEIETFTLVSAWFAGGAIIPLVLAMINTWSDASIGWMIQVIVFVIVSLGLLLGVRPLPFVKKILKMATVPTNADAHFGKEFKLLSDVKGGRSTVSINDVVWTVQVDCECKAGEPVILKGISGNKYIAECVKAEKVEKPAEVKKPAVQKTPVKRVTKKGGK